MNSNLPTTEEFDALEDAIVARARRADRHARIRARVIAAGALVAVGGAGVGGVVLANAQTQRDITYCYEAADLASPNTQVVAATDVRDANGNQVDAGVADAIDKCAAVWRIGFFEPGGPSDDPGTDFPVPDLGLCVRSDGVGAVFPMEKFATNEELCDSLGLSAP